MPKTVNCPDCEGEISVPTDVEVGTPLECPNCGTQVEVINLDPLEVSIIEEEK